MVHGNYVIEQRIIACFFCLQSTMKFTVKTLKNGCRLGCITTEIATGTADDQATHRKIETPMCMLYTRAGKCIILNPLSAKSYYLNVHPLEVVSRCCDTQLQMGENYSHCLIRDQVFPNLVISSAITDLPG